MSYLRELDAGEWLDRLRPQLQGNYYAMYSTLWDGFVRDKALMQIPVDDHMVHRGDGVFEAFRMVRRAIYDFEAHLERLDASAQGIALNVPMLRGEIRRLCCSMGKMCPDEDATFRLFISRGHGSFSANPFEPKRSHLHLVVMPTLLPKDTMFMEGASLGLSRWPAKEPPWSRIKSCNYLQNVMMKRESIEQGVDFTVCLGQQGFIYEGSTENIAIINANGEFVAPRLDYTLKGTTLLRVMSLAREFLKNDLKDIRFDDIDLETLTQAREIMMIGTTWTVMPVTRFDWKPIGSGQVGPFSRRLRELLLEDMQSNSAMRTEVDS